MKNEIKMVLRTKASEELEVFIKEDLAKADPSVERAKAILLGDVNEDKDQSEDTSKNK